MVFTPVTDVLNRLRLHPTLTHPLPSLDLSLFGLLALIDFTGLQHQTAVTGGTASLLDILILTPGQHLQQNAVHLNRAEYPACAALTTGYVFRVENQATVYYLQSISRTGHLTTLSINGTTIKPQRQQPTSSSPSHSILTPLLSHALSLLAAVSTLTTAATLYTTSDTFGATILLLLLSSRALNALLIHRQSRLGWSGQPEPGVKGDLLILLSQDRWVRLQGYVDDLKAVTSGAWLREASRWESALSVVASVAFYAAIALWPNASQLGQMMVTGVLLLGAVAMGMGNLGQRGGLRMHGRRVEAVGGQRRYVRRRALADELITETGRDDWAVRLGMINAEESASRVATREGGVTM